MLVTDDNFETAVSELKSSTGVVVCDTETNGLDHTKNHVVGLVLLGEGTRPFYFPFRHGEGANLPERKLTQLCEEVLRPGRVQMGFNYGFDLKMLHKEGLVLPDKILDSQLAAHLMNENEPSFKMEYLAQKYVNPGAGDAEDALIDILVDRFGGSRKTAKKHLWKLPADKVAEYACQDVVTTRELHDFYEAPLSRWKLESLYHEYLEYELAIARMELRGMTMSRKVVEENMAHAQAMALQLEEDIQRLAGYPLNPRSSKQLQTWLGIPSTAAAILETMDDEKAKLILDYRAWAKVVGTYYGKFVMYADSDFRLHPNLNITGTISGRLSCSRPNLQSIPRQGGAEAYAYVKHSFVAPPGYSFVEADYSQAEIRVMAHYSNDKRLRDTILSGTNMHDVVSEAQGIPRDVAKRLNFAAQYGVGVARFAKEYGYTKKQAAKYLNDYRTKTFPGIPRFYYRAEREARVRGYIRMYTGRVRRYNTKRSPFYKASSNYVQGAVAEMMRIAITRLDKELPEVLQVLTVHDSDESYVETSRLDEILPEMKRIMEHQPWCSIPITVDFKVGKSWGTAKERHVP